MKYFAEICRVKLPWCNLPCKISSKNFGFRGFYSGTTSKTTLVVLGSTSTRVKGHVYLQPFYFFTRLKVYREAIYRQVKILFQIKMFRQFGRFGSRFGRQSYRFSGDEAQQMTWGQYFFSTHFWNVFYADTNSSLRWFESFRGLGLLGSYCRTGLRPGL